MNAKEENIEHLMKDWFRRCRESQMAHYEYGALLARRHIIFGIPTIVLSTIVGTTVFSSLETDTTSVSIRLALGLLSILAAVIAALQTFLNFSSKGAEHKAAGAAYGAIRRELELLKTLPPSLETELRERFEKIKQKMDDLAKEAPSIPSKFKQSIDEKLKSRLHDRIFKLDPET